MSMAYWGIVGYGVKLDDIHQYLDQEKVKRLIREINPNEKFTDDIFDDDTFVGGAYSNFAQFLCDFDDKNIMSFDDNGENVQYLLYKPPYPWIATPEEPKTVKELDDHIVKILQNVYNASADELKEHIDYIDTVGWG